MTISERVLVYGATGHTGRFVVDELLRRGLTPVPAGRGAPDPVAPDRFAALDFRVVGVDDPGGLREAVCDVGAVINCAGPFLDTAVPLARAAVEVGAHYLDVTAEQPVVAQLYRELDLPARRAGVTVVPAMAFYGGLADLLVTAALDGDTHADEVDVAIGLDRWWPTAGTRATGTRNLGPRMVIRGGALAELATPTSTHTWPYPEPFGEQEVVEVPLSEVMTIHRHLDVGELRSFLNSVPLDDLHDDRTPPPTATDEWGRSPQRFVVEVVVRRAARASRAGAAGRDIYAVTAPIVAEAATRLLDGHHHGPGALAPGQAFDAHDVLTALEDRVDDLAVRSGSPGAAREVPVRPCSDVA